MIEDRPATPRAVVRVLGPCALSIGSREVDLSQTQRRLIAGLALFGPRPASTTSLIAAVWGDGAPATARAALHNQVSRIRSTAADDLIVVEHGRYLLRAEVDAYRLGQAVRSAEEAMIGGDPARAWKLADDGVDLCRGQPYADLGDLAEAARRSLVVAREAAENIRVDAALQIGRVAWALQQAQHMVVESPYDEHRAAMLVRALDANGRRGDALAVVTAIRLRLQADLGIDPGTELRGVEEAILNPHFSMPTGSRGREVSFEGRDVELEFIVDAARRGRSVHVCGEPGVGVSSLLSRARAALTLEGSVAVAMARCQANSATAVSVLDDLLAELGLHPPPGLGALGGFIPAISAAALDRPIVLLVDDAELGGPSSRAALAAVAVLDSVAVVWAGHDVPSRADLTISDDLVIELRGLQGSATAELIRARTGRSYGSESVEVESLLRLSGGNPSFLCELLDSLGPGELGGSSSDC